MIYIPDYVTISLVCMCALAVTSAHATMSPRNNFTVTNAGVTCVVMSTGIQLTIPYTAESKNDMATVTVPSNATVNGTCLSHVNIINIYFLNTFTLTIEIRRTNNTYYWSSTKLQYTIDSATFPSATVASGTPVLHTATLDNTTNAVNAPGSYQCDGDKVLQLGGVNMTTSDLRYRAFGNDSSVSISKDNVQQCPVASTATPDTDIALAISVGIALGAFIVVVVLGYVITSRIPRFRRLQED